jgi:hypothetical protein
MAEPRQVIWLPVAPAAIAASHFAMLCERRTGGV